MYIIKNANYGIDINSYVGTSKYFKYGDLFSSQTAVAKNIINKHNNKEDLLNLTKLVNECLDKIYEGFGPIVINSCYRSAALNTAVKGSSTSHHCAGRAADIEPIDDSKSNMDLLLWIHDNINYYELIAEKFGPNPRDGWVHIAYYNGIKRENKLKMLSNKKGSKVVEANIASIKKEFGFA